jgi:hypothetical protein
MSSLVLMQFGSVAAAAQLQNRGADRGPQAGRPLGVVEATGSSAKSRNLGGIVDFRCLTITGLDPVASPAPSGLPT